MRRALRSSAVALSTVSALLLAGCGADPGTRSVFGDAGWQGQDADARNSATTSVTGARSLDVAWTRPLGSPTPARATVAPDGQIFVTSQSEQGCNVTALQIESGRKRWCSDIGPGAATGSPVVDGNTNAYVGEEGAVLSFDVRGQRRWRAPVNGTPLAAQFTGDGNLLVVTQLGQVTVLDPRNGFGVAPTFELIPPALPSQGADLPRTPAGQGVAECFDGGPACPVANSPAIDLDTGRFVLTFRRFGAAVADLVALRYTGGEDPRIVADWSATVLTDGSAADPVLSADARTVYATDNTGTLHALDAATGAPKWRYDLGYRPIGAPSVSADGLVIPAGGEGARLLALRDRGDAAESVWERTDLIPVGAAAQAAGSTGYTAVREGTDGVALLTFDTDTGETLDLDTLPGAAGFTAGTSVGPGGEVLTPTLIGELFVLK